MSTPVMHIQNHNKPTSEPAAVAVADSNNNNEDGEVLLLPRFKKNQRHIDITDHSWCCQRPIDPQPAGEIMKNSQTRKYNQDVPGNVSGLVASAAVSMGTRDHMEDRHRICYSGEGVYRGFFAVFDGHGGEEVAHYSSKHLHQNIINMYHRMSAGIIPESKQVDEKRVSDGDGRRGSAMDKKHDSIQSKYKTQNVDYKQLLEASFDELETNVLKLSQEVGCRDGTTACTVTIVGDTIYCANTGDSRAVLCRAGVPVPLSTDHKPHNADERSRIVSAGGEVHCVMTDRAAFCCFAAKKVPQGAERLWPGGFSVSRAIGDIDYKDLRRKKCKVVNVLIHRPDITVTTISPDDQFIIIATDGLWDVVSNQVACELVAKEITRCKRKDRHWVPSQVAQKLADKAYSLGSEDNITVVVILFTTQT